MGGLGGGGGGRGMFERLACEWEGGGRDLGGLEYTWGVILSL